VFYFIGTGSPEIDAPPLRNKPVSALAFCPSKILSQKAIYGQKLGQNTGRAGQKKYKQAFKTIKKHNATRFYIELRFY
jgi:hypothetical protein